MSAGHVGHKQITMEIWWLKEQCKDVQRIVWEEIRKEERENCNYSYLRRGWKKW